MSRHLITALVLLAALALYGLGFAGLGLAAIVAGAGFELWFWVRLLSRRGGMAGKPADAGTRAPTPPPAP